jgi:hypothetical protein
MFFLFITVFVYLQGNSTCLFDTGENCLNKSGELYVACIPYAPFYLYFVYVNVEVQKYKTIFA